jgi:hypothetical protein
MGFMMYRRSGSYRGKPLYKGLMVAVDERYRGRGIHLSLSPFIHKRLKGEEFYIDATTQLSNTPTIKNYIKARKAFESAKLIYYWQKGTTP